MKTLCGFIQANDKVVFAVSCGGTVSSGSGGASSGGGSGGTVACESGSGGVLTRGVVVSEHVEHFPRVILGRTTMFQDLGGVTFSPTGR